MRRTERALATIAALWLTVTSAAAEQRLALVIGNSAYADSPLANPVNDARLIGGALRAQGFEVIESLDVGRVEMQLAVKDYGNRLKAAGAEAVGLLYYAGHGIQVGGDNYLVPTDAAIEDEGDVPIYAVSASAVLATIEDARNRVNIVILDACRNNPYERGFRAPSRGLALMSAPTGTLIAYSTAPGQVALDGDSANSPYTRALAAAIGEPGVAIEPMFKTVRKAVLAETQGQQTSWESLSLTGDFYMVPPMEVAEPEPSPQFDRAALELAFWQSIQNSDDPTMFEGYLTQYPDGVFAVIAKARLAELRREVAVVTPPPPLPPEELAIPDDPPEAPAVAEPEASSLIGRWEGRLIMTMATPPAACQHMYRRPAIVRLDYDGKSISGNIVADQSAGWPFSGDIPEIPSDEGNLDHVVSIGLSRGERGVLRLALKLTAGDGSWVDSVWNCNGVVEIAKVQSAEQGDAEVIAVVVPTPPQPTDNVVTSDDPAIDDPFAGGWEFTFHVVNNPLCSEAFAEAQLEIDADNKTIRRRNAADLYWQSVSGQYELDGSFSFSAQYAPVWMDGDLYLVTILGEFGGVGGKFYGRSNAVNCRGEFRAARAIN